MYKILKLETAAGTERELNKLCEDGWRVVRAGPDFLVLSDSPMLVAKSRRVVREPDPIGSQDARLRRENLDLTLRAAELEHQLREQVGEESMKAWNDLTRSRNAFRSLCHQLVEQLLWCSGASDFAPGGPAAEGWAKGPRKVLEEYERVCREQR